METVGLSEIVARPTIDLTFNSGSRCRLSRVVAESGMDRLPAITFSLCLASGVGCQSRQRTNTATAGEHAKITFQVDGMMKAKSGAT